MKRNVMKNLTILLTFVITIFVFACNERDSLALADDEFLVVATGEKVKCSNYLFRFRQQDHARLRLFLNPNAEKVDTIGMLNLDVNYDAAQQVVVKIRKLTADEVQLCTADVMWYQKVWVSGYRTL